MTTAFVRETTRTDFGALLSLLKRKAEFDGGLELISGSDAEIEAALFDDPSRCEVLVADLAGDLVGFASFFSTFSTFLAAPGLWLDDLYIDSSVRNRGIGALLIARLAEVAVDRGCARIEWTVAASNSRGIRFYERCGAEIRTASRLARLDRSAIEALASSARSAT